MARNINASLDANFEDLAVSFRERDLARARMCAKRIQKDTADLRRKIHKLETARLPKAQQRLDATVLRLARLAMRMIMRDDKGWIVGNEDVHDEGEDLGLYRQKTVTIDGKTIERLTIHPEARLAMKWLDKMDRSMNQVRTSRARANQKGASDVSTR